MPLNLFYTMVQKSQKWPKTQIKGGGPAFHPSCISGFPTGAPFGGLSWKPHQFFDRCLFPGHWYWRTTTTCTPYISEHFSIECAQYCWQILLLRATSFGQPTTHNLLFFRNLAANQLSNKQLSLDSKVSFYRRDRPARNGGGLLVYVPDDLCTVTRRRPDLENEAIKCLTFELSLDQKHTIFSFTARWTSQQLPSLTPCELCLPLLSQSPRYWRFSETWTPNTPPGNQMDPPIPQEQNSSNSFSTSASHSAYTHPLGSHGTEPAAVLLIFILQTVQICLQT